VDAASANVAVVEQWLAAFDRRWPTKGDLDRLLAPEVRFVERPNLVSPAGSERGLEAMRIGIERGQELFAWQSYEPLDHVASGETVATRMRWRGQLATDDGPWPARTQLAAWCAAHYRIVDGRIAHIEQYDCYEQPVTPAG
jgi:ketosteroid isomerase-like protein